MSSSGQHVLFWTAADGSRRQDSPSPRNILQQFDQRAGAELRGDLELQGREDPAARLRAIAVSPLSG